MDKVVLQAGMTPPTGPLAESALNDLRDILAYYTEQKIPETGRRLVAQILDDVQIMADQPDMGRKVPEFDRDILREQIRRPFRIVYCRDPHQIKVVRVWHSEQL